MTSFRSYGRSNASQAMKKTGAGGIADGKFRVNSVMTFRYHPSNRRLPRGPQVGWQRPEDSVPTWGVCLPNDQVDLPDGASRASGSPT